MTTADQENERRAKFEAAMKNGRELLATGEANRAIALLEDAVLDLPSTDEEEDAMRTLLEEIDHAVVASGSESDQAGQNPFAGYALGYEDGVKGHKPPQTTPCGYAAGYAAGRKDAFFTA